ncbi:MAG: ZIP family metal transporter [Candidatus Dojkabacteria bacterium]
MTLVYSLIATFIVSLISFVGILLFFRKTNSKSSFITSLIAFAAGALLGDAFLHLIGKAIEVNGYSIGIMVYVFAGILLMLVIEAYFHCSHDATEENKHNHATNKVLGNLNTFGNAIHNFLDGIAIAASFLVSPVAGVASTIAIIFHEIPQEFADVGILLYSGWSKKKVLVLNFLTALTAVLGAIFTIILSSYIQGAQKFLIPLAAGQFIYIALADLLPEIHEKAGVKKYVLEIGMFCVGFILMYVLLFLE